MSRHVLIVSPHFPPVNAPDMQRVRVSLPHFIAAGWEVTVLTVADPTPSAPVEPELLATIPAAVRVVRVRCLARTWTRWFGIGNVALRALPFLFFTGCRLLAGRRYDAVYFSTTMFIVLPFGRIWRALYGTPYVIDLQDPWVTDYYSRPGAPPPPGGWKYAASRRSGLLLEGWTLRRAAHVITVSADYPGLLRRRYPDLPADLFTELPFGVPDGDLEHLRQNAGSRRPLLPAGPFRLAFAGALGPGMLGAVEALLAAVAELRRTGVPVTVHFFGTSYADAARSRSATGQLVEKYQLAGCVHEQPGRLPYFDALQVAREAEVNLLFGSSDLGFTPSKLLTLLAIDRPLLAVAHGGSATAARLAALGHPAILLPESGVNAGAIAEIVQRLQSLHHNPAVPAAPLPPECHAAATAATQLAIFTAAAGSRA